MRATLKRLGRAVRRLLPTSRGSGPRLSNLLRAAADDDIASVRGYLTTDHMAALTPSHTGTLLQELARHDRWDEIRTVIPRASLPTQARRAVIKLAMSAGQPEVVRALASSQNSPATTARRLAIAHEHAEQWAEAAAAFREALRSTPDSEHLWKRFERMRRKAPRWGFYAPREQPAWNLAGFPNAATGFVGPAEDGHITGWLPADSGTTEVVIKLNGMKIADTRASSRVTLPDGRDYLEFARAMAALRSYAGTGDVLTVEWEGRALPIIGSGSAHEFTSGKSRADVLLTLLQDGYVLNKYGKVQKSVKIDKEWQAEILDLFARLKQDLAEDLGLDLFPFYGTLLGAIREQGFIGHDNDFDTVYVSAYSTPAEVRAEFVGLCQALIKRGYPLHFTKTHVWVKLPGRPSNKRKIDIFFAWFNSAGDLRVSYGHHGPAIRRSPEFFDFRPAKLGDAEILVPTNSEGIVSQLFGADWRTPDPGFTHLSESRIVDRSYWLESRELTTLHWDQFYRDNAPDDPSPFALEVVRQLGEPGTVIELGCGSGRDSIYFASRGWHVWASDRSTEAIDRARHASGNGTADNLKFASVDAASLDELRDFLKRALDTAPDHNELVVYLRFFFHAVDDETERTILDALTSTISRSFRLCAEFRTVEDKQLAKAHGQHYRRYIEADEFATRLRDTWGFEIDHLVKGQGLSPFEDEDPFLCRVTAHRRPSDPLHS